MGLTCVKERGKGGLCRSSEYSTVLSKFLASQWGVLQPVSHVSEVPSLTGMSVPCYFCYLQSFNESSVWKAWLQCKWDFRAQHPRPSLHYGHNSKRFDWHSSLAATPTESGAFQQNLQVIICILSFEKHYPRIII